jgi:hypothetical protein
VVYTQDDLHQPPFVRSCSRSRPRFGTCNRHLRECTSSFTYCVLVAPYRQIGRPKNFRRGMCMPKCLVCEGMIMESSSRVLMMIAAYTCFALLPPSATSAPLYFARAETGAGSPTVQQFQSTDAVVANAGVLYLTSGGVGTMDASAAAGPGGLHASADATINVPSSGLGGDGSVAAATSRMVLDDIVISPLPGTEMPLTQVPFSLALTISGSLDTLAHIGSPHIGLAEGDANIFVSGSLAGVVFGGDRTKISQAAAATGVVTDFAISGTGILSNGLGALVTPDAMVAINTPFTLDLTLKASATAGWRFDGTTSASTDALATAHANFSNSLTLGSNGRVFNLPAGYTANSIDGMIVDNRLVPEPSNDLLLIMGIALTAAFMLVRG